MTAFSDQRDPKDVVDFLDSRGTTGLSSQSNSTEELMRSRADRRCRSRVATRLAMLGAAVVLTFGCHKFEARVELKKGNALYEAEAYEEALAQFEKGLEIDPAATFAWRSVGLSAMALHRPGVEGDVENDKYADTAVDAFKKFLKDYPRDEKVEEYLTTVLINAGRWDDAIARLEQRAQANPTDPEIERAIGTTLLKAGRLEDALARARKSAKPDPQLLYGIGVAAWGMSYGDPTLDPQRRVVLVDLGLDATKQSIELDPEFFDAMAYYNLLFREKAKLATTFEEAEKLNAEADIWLKKALELRERQKEAGVGTGAEPESS